MSIKPKFLVLWGDGINCENETQKALNEAGADATKVHVSELVENPKLLRDYQGMVIPGGFSFGDHLGSGQILAMKLERFVGAELREFVKKYPLMGICNGFQTLVRLGLLPDANFQKTCSLIKNEQGHFMNKWVELERNPDSPCVWTKNLPAKVSLPARHGEGRFVCESEAVLKGLQDKNQIVFRYSQDFNGATDRIAGICDPSGLVFALMPHPEAAVHDWQMPFAGQAYGLEFFKSAVQSVKDSTNSCSVRNSTTGALLKSAPQVLSERINVGTIKRALLSVSDKTNLLDLAKVLSAQNVELIASGGTATALQKAGFAVTPVEKLSGKGEAFQGRMKTISFEIASALLFRRQDPEDVKTAKDLNIEPIDLVVVNLYPFHETLAKGGTFAECIENIDIGGPTLLRAAAKNHASVTVLNDPSQYAKFIQEFQTNSGSTTAEFRMQCAQNVFAMTAFYDMAIAGYLQQQTGSALRYGENPHQKASVLPDPFNKGLAHKKSLQGKEMSYNNFLDADFAVQTLKDTVAWQGQYAHPTAVVVKHNTPCGLAVSETPLRALELAWKGDEKSSFGGILAFNFPVTKEIAAFFENKFIEVILAPSFDPDAQTMLKKNCRLVELSLEQKPSMQIRSIDGGVLLQEKDSFQSSGFKLVTERAFPSDKERLASFAMLCVKNMKSNAIAICRQEGSEFEMVTLGTGQTNRVDCIEKLVIPRLADKGITDVSGMVLASDAFFPFPDSIEIAAKVGVKFLVQPGGSVKDPEVIAEANKRGLAMMFTGRRHFLH